MYSRISLCMSSLLHVSKLQSSLTICLFCHFLCPPLCLFFLCTYICLSFSPLSLSLSGRVDVLPMSKVNCIVQVAAFRRRLHSYPHVTFPIPRRPFPLIIPLPAPLLPLVAATVEPRHLPRQLRVIFFPTRVSSLNYCLLIAAEGRL